MTNLVFVIGRVLLAHAALLNAVAAPYHEQQPWQPSTQSIPEHDRYHTTTDSRSSSKAYVWSLSTTESHRQPFPSFPYAEDAGARVSHTETAAWLSTASPGFLNSAVAGQLRWSLSNANGSIQIDALLPSLVHLDLIRAGVIDDPSIGLNEGLYWWIANEPTWTYTADLEPILEQLWAAPSPQHHQFWLYFQGLDTVTRIYVGGTLIGETCNYYKWYAFRIPSHLVEQNTSSIDTPSTNITLVFQNVNQYAAQQAAEHGPDYPSQLDAPQRPRTFDYEFPNRIFVRKQQSDLGWDWGPALVPVGPNRNAYLLALPGSAQTPWDEVAEDERKETTDVDAETKPTVLVMASAIDIYRKGQTNNLPPPYPDADWIINVTLTLLSSHDVQHASLRLSIPSLGLFTFDALLLPSSPVVSAGLNKPVYATFEIPSRGQYGPSLWWPRGYGEQTLYDLVLHSDELGIEVRKRVGFRTAVIDMSNISSELVEEENVQPGSHFRLLVNGEEIYIIGTNMIPLDTLSPRTNPAYLRWLLESAMLTHVNLIRIWGGGAYPSQALLDLCDELGIMIWMDAMFAASLYPYYNEFVRDASTEVGQVMVDVVTHPSIVAVVGNNEGELFFEAYGKLEQDAGWLRGYELLFDQVIRDRVREVSRGLSYIPCSTTTGYIQLDPYVGRYGNYSKSVELHGTGEHYGYVAAQAFDIDTYPRSRFMVEFGMFSLPSIHTLDRILGRDSKDEAEIYSINSSVLRAHLKHPPAGNLTYPFAASQGQSELLSVITTYFPTPSAALGPRAELHRYTVSSQLFQSIYVANQIAVYRRGAARRERNRGLVVWQLNDVWEGTSWSSIEYTGRWKMVHYTLADVQAPVAAVAVYNQTADRLEVDVVFGGAHEGDKVDVKMEWFDFTGVSLGSDEKSVQLDGSNGDIGAITVETIDSPWKTVCKGGEKGCYLRLSLRATGSVVYWTPMKQLATTIEHLHSDDPRPNLTLSTSRHRTVQLSNTGTATAPFVWLEHETKVGYFASCGQRICRPTNGFWLNPGEEVEVRFVAAEQDGGQLAGCEAEAVRVSSVFDNLVP